MNCLEESPYIDPSPIHRIKKARAKLVNEEHRLALMKKIRQSQTRPIQQQQQQQQQQPNQSQQPNQVQQQQQPQQLQHQHLQQANSLNQPHQPVSIQQNQPQSKKLRTSQNSSNSLTLPNSISIGSSSHSQLNQTPAHAHQRPKVNALWNPPQQNRLPTPIGIAPPHVGNMSRNPITTPPNVVQAIMSNLVGQQSRRTSSTGSRRQSSQHQSQPQQQQQVQHQTPIGITPPHVGNMSRNPITTPPNVVQAIMNNFVGQQPRRTPNSGSRRQSSQQQQQTSQLSQQQLPQTPQNQSQAQRSISSPFSKPQDAQLLVQKRSAARIAIQKQLEQTLIQLPQQKQIQQGIEFLPNVNMEFCYALGLEACVDYLTNTKNNFEAPIAEKPYVCSTCGNDFTPSWSWKRSQVFCENCTGNHAKKSIKSSHGSRIKSVLAKASKQEKEMDLKIMAEAASATSSAPSPSSSSSPLTTSNVINNSNNNSNQPNQHSLLQKPSSGRNSNNQSWNAPRANHPQNNTPNMQNLPTPSNVINPGNLLSSLPPALLASLLQLPPVGAPNQNSNNQFAQMAQLLMNLMRR